MNNVVFSTRREIASVLDGCAMTVTDANVYALYGDMLRGAYVIPAGEASKNRDVLFGILSEMSARGLNRSDIVAAVGGGVVCDVTGLAAALYMRGIEHINVPTTLLAAADAGIGGKTAVNLDGKKNLVGAFHMPKAVYVDFSFAASLPRRELLCGLGEIFKTCLLTRKAYAQLVSLYGDAAKLRLDALQQLARSSIEVKCEVVERDFRDNGLRRVLNVGHTVGHALESAENGAKSHGEYVLEGTLAECSMCTELVDGEYLGQLRAMLGTLVGFPKSSAKRLLGYAVCDKKNGRGSIELMLPTSPGEVTGVRLTPEEFAMRYDAAGAKCG